MPNGYRTLQVYFPVGDAELAHFVAEMGRGERSAYIRDAIRMKRAMDGEETMEVAIIRRVIREELAEFLSQIPKNAAPNFVANFESSPSGDEADLADFVGRNQF